MGEQCLVFAVNGQRFEHSGVDPSTTLLEFLRSQTSFKSVKLGCGEGLSFLYFSIKLRFCLIEFFDPLSVKFHFGLLLFNGLMSFLYMGVSI